MFKKILLVLALISVIAITVFGALSGTYTSNNLFYLPGYGSYGIEEYNAYNAAMQVADYQIEANKTASANENIQDVAGSMFSENTETFVDLTYQDADGTIDAVVPVKDEDNMTSNSATHLATQQSIKAHADTLHALQYLKTDIDTQGEVETIWGVTLATDTELAALKFTDLTDTPATYDDGKYAKSTAGGVVWDTLAGYSNLTSFVDQTAWRVFYSNTDGDVVELALGADGTYLKSNGAAVAPTFSTPAGAGDMLKATYDTDADGDIDVAAGGTEKSSWTQYCIPYLSGTTTFGEILIGTAGQVLKVNAGATGYECATLSYLANMVEDTTPELGGEMDCGAHSIGFTQQSTTGDGTTTIDWRLGNKFKFTFGAQNDTFTFTAPTNPCNILLMLIQDATGSRTATWPATVKWVGGTAPTLTTAANSIDIVSFYWDGTNYFGVASLAFATP